MEKYNVITADGFEIKDAVISIQKILIERIVRSKTRVEIQKDGTAKKPDSIVTDEYSVVARLNVYRDEDAVKTNSVLEHRPRITFKTGDLNNIEDQIFDKI